MGQKYLLDTNVILGFIGKQLPIDANQIISNIVDTDINISIINKIELLGFQKVETPVELVIANSNIYSLVDDVVNKTIELRKVYKIKLPDAVIAATSLVNNMILVTRNEKDFNKIDGLQVWNPFL